MKTIQPFRKCHLQILRSLYVGQDGVTAQEHQVDGTSLGAAINDGDGIGNGAIETKKTNNNAETKHGCKDMSNDTEGAAVDKDNDSEGLVGSEIWDLIERFLQRRMEYPPHKERQIHWAEINAEAQSRLDHLVSITSSVDEEKILPMQSRSSSLTPRTPLFSHSGRGGSMTPSMSLTPQSSNRNAPKLSQNEREMASTIPAWNIINQMLQRRSKLCTNSCQSFRSQPYLAHLRNEADMRCSILERVMKRLKVGTSGKQQQNLKSEGSTILNHPVGKRQKLEIDVTRPTIPSSLGHFFSNEYSTTLTRNDRDARDDEIRLDEDSIMETQMKLCLWSSLLSSVKEIVDES